MLQNNTPTIVLLITNLMFICACGSDAIEPSSTWQFEDVDDQTIIPPKEDPPEEDPPKEDPPKEDPPETKHDAKFVGIWVVHDNVPRGGITADVFHFHEDGKMELLQQYDPAGIVLKCDDEKSCNRFSEGMRCAFGKSWSSAGPNTLLIEGDCSDNQTRTIVLSFSADREPDMIEYEGYEAKLISVNGEKEGWVAASFQGPASSFFFNPCKDESRCSLP